MRALLKNLARTILLLSIFSCEKSESNLPIAGPFQLHAIDREICPNTFLQMKIFEQSTGKEISFSEFTFEPIPISLGEINSNGLYKAPDLIIEPSTVDIILKWKFNPNITSSYRLYLKPNSNLNLKSKIPYQKHSDNVFYDVSESNDFLFGSPPPGTGPAKTLSFDTKVVNASGQTKWARNLGVGQTTMGFFYHDYTLVSGWVMDRDGSSVEVTKIYNQNGNELKKDIEDKGKFLDFFIGKSGDVYLSNSAKSYHPNPAEIVQLSPDFQIIRSMLINYPIESFLINQDESIVAYYMDDLKKESGVVMIDKQGIEKWNILIPHNYAFVGKLVALNNYKYGLVMADCKVIPCELELVYYEIGVNGELIISGQTIARSIPLEWLINSTMDDQQSYYISEAKNFIVDVVATEEEVLVVFYAITQNYEAIMIKGTLGSSLEYWWDNDLEDKGQTAIKHISIINNSDGLLWKTFCGEAICTFQLDKNLAFNPCFN